MTLCVFTLVIALASFGTAVQNYQDYSLGGGYHHGSNYASETDESIDYGNTYTAKTSPYTSNDYEEDSYSEYGAKSVSPYSTKKGYNVKPSYKVPLNNYGQSQGTDYSKDNYNDYPSENNGVQKNSLGNSYSKYPAPKTEYKHEVYENSYSTDPYSKYPAPQAEYIDDVKIPSNHVGVLIVAIGKVYGLGASPGSGPPDGSDFGLTGAKVIECFGGSSRTPKVGRAGYKPSISAASSKDERSIIPIIHPYTQKVEEDFLYMKQTDYTDKQFIRITENSKCRILSSKRYESGNGELVFAGKKYQVPNHHGDSEYDDKYNGRGVFVDVDVEVEWCLSYHHGRRYNKHYRQHDYQRHSKRHTYRPDYEPECKSKLTSRIRFVEQVSDDAALASVHRVRVVVGPYGKENVAVSAEKLKDIYGVY